MRIITGDECGLLKECIPELARVKNLEPGKVPITKNVGTLRINSHDAQTRKCGIVGLTWMQPQQQEDDDSFASLSLDGTVKIEIEEKVGNCG